MLVSFFCFLAVYTFTCSELFGEIGFANSLSYFVELYINQIYVICFQWTAADSASAYCDQDAGWQPLLFASGTGSTNFHQESKSISLRQVQSLCANLIIWQNLLVEKLCIVLCKRTLPSFREKNDNDNHNHNDNDNDNDDDDDDEDKDNDNEDYDDVVRWYL